MEEAETPPQLLLHAGEIEGGPPEGVSKIPALQIPAHNLGRKADSHFFGHARSSWLGAAVLEIVRLLAVCGIAYPSLCHA